MNLPRPLRALLCAFLATAIGVTIAVPATVVTARPAQATPVTLNLYSVQPGDGQAILLFTDPDGLQVGWSYTADCVSSGTGAEATGGDGSDGIVMITGLDNFQPYTCTVFVKDSNDAIITSSNESSVFTPGVTPPQPTNVVAVAHGYAAIQLTFDFDNPDSIPLTDFVGACTETENPGAPSLFHGATSPLLVTGLTIGVEYQCFVQSENEVGPGNTSDPSNPITLVTVPNAPAITNATAGDASITIDFSTPETGGDPITGYTASCASDNGTPGSQSGASSPITVSNLDNNEAYTCTVHATNSVGDSAESGESDAVTPAAPVVATAPSAPTNVQLANPSSRQIAVSFAAPDDGGDPVTSYAATCTSSDGGATVSDSDLTTTITVDGATATKHYTCVVNATNTVGTSADSGPSNEIQIATTWPAAPPKPTVFAGSEKAYVFFTPPADDGGSEILDSFVGCASDDGGDPGSGTVTASPAVITGLTNGKTYHCTYNARNENGAGDPSPASDDFTPGAVPDPPATASLSTMPGDNKLRVSFTPGDDNGSIILDYTATCASANGGVTRTGGDAQSPITVDNLTNDKNYTCTVVATNDNGDSAPSNTTNSVHVIAAPAQPDAPAVSTGDGYADVTATGYTPTSGAPADVYDATCTPVGGDPETDSTSESGATTTVRVHLPAGSYTCTITAVNSVAMTKSDASEVITVTTVPDPPAAPTVATGDHTAIVTFAPPANDGGDTITVYRAQCDSSDGGTSAFNVGASSPLTVTGLTSGKNYTCQVRATNSTGTGAYSDPSDSFLAVTVPSKPAKPTLNQTNGATATIDYTASSDNGGSVITGYTVTCTSTDGGTTRTGSGSTSPISVANLTRDKIYTCAIVATNAIGNSAASDASDQFSAPTTAPSAPGKPTVVPIAGQKLRVTYTAPTDDGGLTITNYNTVCTNPPSSDDVRFGSANALTIDIDATEGVTYQCHTRAYNGASDNMGWSSFSANSDTVTAADVPGAPTSVSATQVGAAVRVGFTAPNAHSSAITGYDVACTSGDGGAPGTASGTSSPIDVSGLTRDKNYSCTVTATNAIGTSAASAGADALFATNVPDPPTNATAASGAGQLLVTFDPPADTGGLTISQYTATCTSSNGGATGSASDTSSGISVAGLTNGYSYTCAVIATNSLGDSDASDPSALRIPNVNAGAPGIIAKPAVERGDQQITVDFDPPASGDASIDSYTVTCSDGSSQLTNTGTSSPIIVHGTLNSVSHTCWVTATNSFGEGPASPESDPVTPAGVPQPPTNVQVTLGYNKVKVTFDETVDDGGDAITSYRAACDSGGLPITKTGSTSPIFVTGLTNDQTYTCFVYATNTVGDSLASNTVDNIETIGDVAPAAPTIAQVEPIDGGLTVAVTPGENLGSDITTYHALCFSNDGGTQQSGSSASGSVSVTGLTPTKNYSCAARVENAAGLSQDSGTTSPVEVTAHPDAPAKPTVTPGDGQASVAFVAPSANGSTITGYAASCTSSDGGDPSSNTNTTSPVVVTGLENAHHYTCTVTATNGVGTSDASPASDSVLVTALQPPDAPTGVHVERRDLGVRLTWNAVSDPDETITGYSAECVPTASGTTQTATATDQPIDVSNLVRNTEYQCRVKATNAAGDSDWSDLSDAFPAITAPAPPATVSIVPNRDGFDVSFDGTTDDGGATPVNYEATCTSSDGGVTNVVDDVTSPIHVGGLTYGKTYACSVFAANPGAASAETFSNSMLLSTTVPGPPTDVTASSADGALIVDFNSPVDDGGNAITNKTVTCTSSDGGATGTLTSNTLPMLVSGLTNGATYTCAVVATNSIGDSASSDPSNTATPAANPGAPGMAAKPTVTRNGFGAVDVAFSAPFAGATAITSYTATCTSSDGGDPGTQSGTTSPITVGTLTKGKTYSCTITANNTAGAGTESPVSDPIKPGAVPGAPTNVLVTRVSPAGASVTMTDGNNDGSAITDYRAQCTSSNGGTANGTNSSRPIVVSPLTIGKTYTCTGYAFNAEGMSVASDPSAPFVVASVPSAPGAPTNIDQNDDHNAVSVSFAAPDANGDDITGYSVTCTSSDGGDPGTGTGPLSPVDVTGLTPERHYSCAVTATNALGDSAEGTPSNVFSLGIREPAAPVIDGVNGLEGGLRISFIAPHDNGSAITGYDAVCTSNDGGVTGTGHSTTAPIDVTNLTVAATYTCTMTASNAIGPSPASDPSDPTIAAGVPDIPDTPTVDVLHGAAAVTGESADDNGSPIDKYAAVCVSSDGGTTRNAERTTLPVIVSGLTDGKTYACQLRAHNAAGYSEHLSLPSDDFVVHDGAPEAPFFVSASPDWNDGLISVDFQELAPGGGSITGYDVTCTSSNGGVTMTATGTDAPIAVNGGTGGAFYSCTVVARGSLGDSPASSASNSVTFDVKPPAPTSVDVTRGDNSAFVYFTVNTNNGSPITDFNATCTSSNGGTTRIATGNSSPVEVKNLSHGSLYACTVAAANDAGAGPESDPSDPFTAITTPGAPSVLGVIVNGTTGTVSFFAPSDDGGDAIDVYDAVCTSSDGGTQRFATGSSLSGSPMQLDVENLSKGAYYTCHVSAQNEAGTGPDSSDTSPAVWVLPTAPGAPTNIGVTGPTGTDLVEQVSFTAPADTGGVAKTISGYTATCASSDGGATAAGTGTGSPVAVSGFTAGKTYTCAVAATNDVNTGDPSTGSDAFVADVVPTVPTGVIVTRINSTSATVAFAPGANNGTPVTTFDVECASSDGGAVAGETGASSPITVTDFEPGHRYRCEVDAHNDAGGSGASDESAVYTAGDPPAATHAPSVTGTLIAQRKLTAHPGTWTAIPAPSVTRRWQRCNANLSGCADIGGATGATYTLTNADVDKRIRYIETATNGVGSGSSTRITGVVKTVPVATTGPYYYVSGSTAGRAPAGTVGVATHGNTVWRATANGNVFGPHFGPGDGTLTHIRLKKPIVGIVATPSGRGYWMFAADGGVFTFGDAKYLGSTGNLRLKAPIISMTAMPDGSGYWLYASDGGVFTFGGARYYGSLGAQRLASPVVAMLGTASGHGYWLVTRDGRALRFGDATDIGRAKGHNDIVGVVSTGSGFRFITAAGTLVLPTR